jgi:CheY-like chemotaxis protein
MALLRKLGCAADLARNGLEALKLARQNNYDLILMDCHMPEMEGFEATMRIRAWESGQFQPAGDDFQLMPRRTPIVALTASVMPEDKDRCRSCGMDDFLAKPVDTEELKRVLDQWGRRTGQGTESGKSW